MRRIIPLIFFTILISSSAFAQNTFKARIKDAKTGEPLIGVNAIVEGTSLGSSSNEEGIVDLKNIPDGNFTLKFSYIGYEDSIITIVFPDKESEMMVIVMKEQAEELEEISVTSTRSSRLIDDEPTRVEVITEEEIDEKVSMDPSNISMLLSESTGIQVQQISAASVNSTFKIQGLDGRYTQLLKDGFPLYAGFSGSLSINQIPPLDLSQVEIIKGSSSTLYGEGAIAGLINLISKQPKKERDLSFLANGTSAFGLDVSGFYSQWFDNYAIKFFTSYNNQKAYDNNNDNFSDIPEIKRFSINPMFYFFLDENSALEIGGSITTENRLGGSMPVIKKNVDSIFTYSEENSSDRYSTKVKYEFKISNNKKIIFKNSLGLFKREIKLPGYVFKGDEFSSFSELSYSVKEENVDWIFGVNIVTDDFTDKSSFQLNRNYSDLTLGGFIQNTFDISNDIILESGFRSDYSPDYGFFTLPRISLQTKLSKSLTSRIGGGFGYKLPSLFSEDAEQINYKNIVPLNSNIEAEKSIGFTADINFRTILFDEITFTVNQLFFYTRINDPITLADIEPVGYLKYENLDGHYDTRGTEINLKITYEHFKLFIGYTYIDARTHLKQAEQPLALTPKNKIGIVLMYEEHDKIRIGLEGYYTGKQKLSDGTIVTDFWITGLMIEKMFENISLFVNFENILDTRQSKYSPMYTGTPSNPVFAEIYAPTDGRIINGGIKIRL